jgi:2-polyprenyl-6-methoxyphenol hydroxylase-like FAD-dependent oxidoreductase
MSASVLIVGAGPTGMTLAIELARFGVEVRIIDKADHMAQWSQALVVQARTLEQFQRYGVADEAVARGRKAGKAQMWSEGKQIVSIELGPHIKSRYPFLLFLPQSETEAILNAKMESLGVRTERGVELISLTQDEAGVQGGLRHPDGTEETVTPRWVVGCDGAHSTVRSASGIQFGGESIALSFFLGDLALEGRDVPNDAIAVHLHRGDVVFLARLTDRLTRMIVALHDNQGKEQAKDLTIEDFQRAIDAAGVQVKIIDSAWMTPFRVNDLQAEHYRAGRVFLAGDASHIHSPVGGQGMNTGIQDAANLGWKLAAVAHGADEVLLDSYEQEREAVGKVLLQRTGAVLKLATSANVLVEKMRDTLAPFFSGREVVRDTIAGFVSETAIDYRKSRVVEDLGGDGALRAGDRMPDLRLGSGSLLGDWREAEPLLVLVDAEASAEVAGVRTVRVSADELNDEGRACLGLETKAILVRPDGYVGYRGPENELGEHLRLYGLEAFGAAL